MDHQNVHTQGPSVNNLFPSIAQSFVIILIGYLFGRFKIISPSDSHSIGSFVGKLALPALLFKNLAVIDLKSVSWCLIAGILIAKAVIFFAVAICTFFATRPFNLGKAGIFAICSVHSNDLAIGLPIGTFSNLFFAAHQLNVLLLQLLLCTEALEDSIMLLIYTYLHL